MDQAMKRHMAESVRSFRLPRYSEIPNVGLYLEQTTKYINGHLAPLGCLELTGSMVSNYVKKGLVPAPVKKLYYPEQIAYLFFVAFAKNLMRIEDIITLISLQRDSYTLPVAYDYLCDELDNMLPYVFGMKDSYDDLGVTQSDEKDLLRNLVFASVNAIYLQNCCQEVRKLKENK